MKGQSLSIIVSTPYMDEADRCDRVALIQRGRILAIDTPKAITASFDRPLIAVKPADRYKALQALRAFPGCGSAYPFGETIHFTDKRSVSVESTISELRTHLSQAGVEASVEQIQPTIEDLFISRMGEAA
jgi:ABC-type multidrug transport system ATPase subunit